MGPYLDSLNAARAQRRGRMGAGHAASPQPNVMRRDSVVPASRAEALLGEQSRGVLARLNALERRMAALVDALPEIEDGGPIGLPVETLSANPPRRRPRVSDVKRVICREFGVTADELESKSRVASILRARQIAMHLARQLAARSFSDIGRLFGDRDHTIALKACDKIERRRAADAKFDRDLAALEARIRG